MRKQIFLCCILCFAFLSLVDAKEDNHCEKIFTNVWKSHYWGGDSLSGTGSDFTQTAVIQKAIPALLKKYDCRVMIDAPCGDFYWMRVVDLPLEKYIGVDVVRPLIEANQAKFSDSLHSFIHLDLTTHVLPKADLILCRDCLVHFSYADIAKAIKLFKQSGSTYLLTTCFSNANHFMLNDPIGTGEWRPLDLRLPPFNFPEPLEIINENCTVFVPMWNDKSLFLWKIDELPNLEPSF